MLTLTTVDPARIAGNGTVVKLLRCSRGNKALNVKQRCWRCYPAVRKATKGTPPTTTTTTWRDLADQLTPQQIDGLEFCERRFTKSGIAGDPRAKPPDGLRMRVHNLADAGGHGRKFVGGLGPGGGVCEVEAAGGVEGVFG